MASMRGTLVLLLAVWAIFTTRTTAQEGGAEKPATVIFRLPADAILTVDNVKTTKTGSERKFVTAPLQTGIRYFYNVQAEWEPNNYTKITRPRKVIVRAGETVEVDLRQQDPKQPDKIFVRYVPTPQSVVDAMLKMGKATKGDIVYDLGCGDGRIPVTAVAKFGAQRGVGIDLDPQRIKECQENARAAGPDVEKKLDFRQEDVLKLKDLGDATLVTLYLGEDLNRQLKPILRKTLKPGSRIVSHRFLLGNDWKPDRTETLMFEGVEYKLHLWTVPGDNPNRGSEKQP
ncbi:MAG: TIGR03000 domain-containing protein [Gemmataceae bacterium]